MKVSDFQFFGTESENHRKVCVGRDPWSRNSEEQDRDCFPLPEWFGLNVLDEKAYYFHSVESEFQ